MSDFIEEMGDVIMASVMFGLCVSILLNPNTQVQMHNHNTTEIHTAYNSKV